MPKAGEQVRDSIRIVRCGLRVERAYVRRLQLYSPSERYLKDIEAAQSPLSQLSGRWWVLYLSSLAN